jgi:hypothetical protein
VKGREGEVAVAMAKGIGSSGGAMKEEGGGCRWREAGGVRKGGGGLYLGLVWEGDGGLLGWLA